MGATLRGLDATRPVPFGGYQIVRIADISQDGVLVNEKLPHIDPQQPINCKLILQPGDVLFPNRGTRTTASVYRREAGPTIAGAQLFILRPSLDRLIPEYVAWALRTERAASYFEGRRKGTYVQILQVCDLAEFELPVPPVALQERIVAVAELARKERDLMLRLAELRTKFLNLQLLESAKVSAETESISNS